ncbi:MAG: hypothetical protein ACRD3E_02885 [Terriglobales bacterium]
MKRTYQFVTTVALLAMIAMPLMAQNGKIYREGGYWIEEVTGTLSGAHSLRVHTESGSLNVQGGTQQDITYTARKRVRAGSEEEARRVLSAFRVSAGNRNGMAYVEGSADGRNSRNFSVDIDVTAPRDLESVRAETDGGSIAVRNIGGRVNAESGGGSVKLTDISGPVTAETGGGSVEVNNVTGELNLQTGGGSIKVNSAKGKLNAGTGGGSITIGDAQQAVTVQTGGGSIQVQNCGGEVRASTGGGSIDVGDVGGAAEVETGGGSIKLASAKGWVTASTGGGSIQLWKLSSGARAESGAGSITAEFLGVQKASTLETSVGDVIVYLSPNAKLTVNASVEMANGHHIIAKDFPDLKITSEGGEWGPRSYTATGTINGGGPVLRVRTTTGNIEFRKASR